MATCELIEQPMEENLAALSLDELAQQANNAAGDVDEYASATVEAAVRCGMLLITAKTKVKHGQWLAWVEENFSRDASVAQRYMKIAKTERAPFLKDASSVRDAIRKIAGPKEGSEEQRHDKVAAMLRGGKTHKEVAAALHIQQQVVAHIYKDIIIPELLEVDWRSVVNKALVKEMAIAKHTAHIEAEYRSKGLTGGALDWVASEMRVHKAMVSHARKVISDGCVALVNRAKDGDIALSTAAAIANGSQEEQMKELATLDRKKTVDVVDDLRSRVSLMLDQKLGWTRDHGNEEELFRDLRNTADATDVAEIYRNLLLVRDWTSTIATLLGDE